ncbi:hypothetical protein GGR51DRAFT_574067 [Nemania sp. FL0031]|nr:hypothetical protein GGR51DRAFT_574067 [Nemania sp. FL0031]
MEGRPQQYECTLEKALSLPITRRATKSGTPERTHYEIALFDVGVDGAGFRVEYDGNELQHAAIDQYRDPDIKHRFKHAEITVAFVPVDEPIGNPDGPIVKHLAPDEATQTRVGKFEAYGSLEGGWNPITPGLGGSFEQTSTTDTKSHAILKGVSWIEGHNKCAKNAATWDLRENLTLANGMSPTLRVAILLELPDERKFRAAASMTADVGMLHGKVKRRGGAKTGLDPVYFDPSAGRDFEPPPEAAVRTNLSSCNLNYIGFAKSIGVSLIEFSKFLHSYWATIYPRVAKWTGVTIKTTNYSLFCESLLKMRKPYGGTFSPWLRELPFASRVSVHNDFMSFSSEQSLLDKSALEAGATALLAELSNDVQKKRPLVFLCNNTGGILVKEVMPSVNLIQETGLKCLGVQRRGLTEVIHKGASALQAATFRFEMIKNEYQIISLHEVPPTEIGGVVENHLNKDDLSLNILVPVAGGKLPLSQPIDTAFEAILRAIGQPRKDLAHDTSSFNCFLC